VIHNVSFHDLQQHPCSQAEAILKQHTLCHKVKGIISESEYIEQSVKVTEEKIAFEKQVTELSEQLTQIQTTIAIHENKKLITSQYVGTRKLSKEMVSVLIDYILVGRTDPLTKETPVEIHWNF